MIFIFILLRLLERILPLNFLLQSKLVKCFLLHLPEEFDDAVKLESVHFLSILSGSQTLFVLDKHIYSAFLDEEL